MRLVNDAGGRRTSRTSNGQMPLGLCVGLGSLELVKLIVSEGADVLHTTPYGLSVLDL